MFRCPVIGRCHRPLVVFCVVTAFFAAAALADSLPRVGFSKVVMGQFFPNASAPAGAPPIVDDDLAAFGGAVVEKYGATTVGYVPKVALEQVRRRIEDRGLEFRLRDDFDLVFLPGGVIDTRIGMEGSLPGKRKGPPERSDEANLYIVQFVGPIREEWLTDLRAANATLVQYVPYNAYIVAAEARDAVRIGHLRHVQYVDVFHASLKPIEVPPTAGTRRDLWLSLANVPAATRTVERLQDMSPVTLTTRIIGGSELRVQGNFDGSDIPYIVEEPLVFAVSRAPVVVPSDERVGLSVTRHVTTSGSGATAPALGTRYSRWLEETCEYCTNLHGDGFWVGIADVGFDDGPGGGDHPNLPDSRVYFGTSFDPNPPPPNVHALADPDGHGTMVAGLAAGGASPATADGEGFLYGIGVAPSAGVFVTKQYTPQLPRHGPPWGYIQNNPTTIFQSASDARMPDPLRPTKPTAYIQNHSWNEAIAAQGLSNNGCTDMNYEGEYDVLAREFDRAVLDADNNASNGSQPIALVVSSGNIYQHEEDWRYCDVGAWSLTLPPATAKNVLAVGGTESVRTAAAEQWGCLLCTAESFSNIMATSKRGTKTAGWFKPDLFAPASSVVSLRSHHQGASKCVYPTLPGSTAVSLPADYDAGTGTSFAAPAASGAALLASRVYAQAIGQPTNAGAASPSLLKAMLIASARTMRGGLDRANHRYDGGLISDPIPITSMPGMQGFGRLVLEDLLSGYPARVYVNESPSATVTSGQPAWSRSLKVHDGTQPVTVALVWSDPPALQNAAYSSTTVTITPLVNDLDLAVDIGSPCTTRYLGNRTNTVDQSVPYGCTATNSDTFNNVELVRFTAAAGTTFSVGVGIATQGTAQNFSLVVMNAYDSAASAPPPPPQALVATATGTTVNLAWTASAGATSYDVRRKTGSGGFATVGQPSAAAFVDTGVQVGHSYIYEVRARKASGVSPFSNRDAATLVAFTDPMLTGVVVKAVHVTELRAAVNALQLVAEHTTSAYTNPALGGLNPAVIDVTELRTRLNAALVGVGIQARTFTDPSITAGTTVIRAIHLEELRDALK